MAPRLTRSTVRHDLVLPLLLAFLVLAPVVLHRGYTLRGDMVFVPDQPWKLSWLGLDGGVPRAVPSDALTWLAGTVLPGDLVQKTVLVATLVLAGLGTARLVRVLVGQSAGPWRSWLVTAPSVALVMWNPYVYERLSIGHWALLCGYAALPWVVLLAHGPRPLLTVLPVAAASWTSPTGGVLATVTALVVLVLVQPRREAVLGSLLVMAANLPWVLPGVLAPTTPGGAVRVGTETFAARADTPWGPLGSLASFGGLWKVSVDAPGRDTWLLSGLGVVLALAGAGGMVLLARRLVRPDRLAVIALGAVGLVGLVLAWLPTTGTGLDLMTALGGLPGGGLLRDSQKWVAPLVPAVAVGLAELAHRWLPRGGHGTFWTMALAALPLAALPGLGWGLAGTLGTTDYPREWDQVRQTLERAGASDERTVVLPFDVYRRFPWNGEVALLDPAPRFFPGEVVVDDALPVGAVVVPGESTVATRVRAVAGDSTLSSAGAAERLGRVLREEGIRFVLVERATPGGPDVPLPGGRLLHDGPELTLVDLGGGDPPRRLGDAGLLLVLGGDVLALVVVVGAGVISRGRGAAFAGRL